jgi:acetyltransferase-like isoleucine patch superfamily enzyme
VRPQGRITVSTMENKKKTGYKRSIEGRTKYRYLRGLLPRYISYLRNSYIVWLARRRGAQIGECVTMPYALAKKANANLTVGNHSSIQTEHLDLRTRVEIGNHVIIGADVEIITVSHDVDSPDYEQQRYGLTIEDYCWLATRAFILPSCQKIERGAVCGAGSVVACNIAAMSIVVGNPAKLLRMRKNVHADLCVESLLGNDYLAYVEAYKK